MSVTIYSTPTCGYCRMAKEYFDEKGIGYTDHNVMRDRARAEEMMQKSGQMGVPVLDVNGKIVVGFNRPAIERALQV